MADPNIRDFYDRVARVVRARNKGLGFEAPGTLGLSHYTAGQRRLKMPVMTPVLILFGSIVTIKALIHSSIGDGVYDARVDTLWQAEGIERVGAMLMHADPLTRALSDLFTRLVG
jgi:hypothetical protein